MNNKQLTNLFKKYVHILNNDFFYIDKAWFYGSRYRGDNRLDSDYDIAIKIIWDSDKLNLLFQKLIKEELGEKVKIDIKFYDDENPEHTPEINSKMSKGNVLIYKSSI